MKRNNRWASVELTESLLENIQHAEVSEEGVVPLPRGLLSFIRNLPWCIHALWELQ